MESISSDAIIIELLNKKIISTSKNNLDVVFNFNNLLSYPYINNNFIKLIYHKLKNFEVDTLVGISNITKHYASILSHNYNINLLILSDRNLKKIYGDSEKSRKCTIIVDIVYKIHNLRQYIYFITKQGIKVENIIFLCNNGFLNVFEGIKCHFILDLEHIKYILGIHRIIDKKVFIDTRKNFIKKDIGHVIFDICKKKKTRICLDCRIINIKEIIKLIEITGEYISMFFINSNIIENFTLKYGMALRTLSHKYNFILVNDISASDNFCINREIEEWCDIATLSQFFDTKSFSMNNKLKYIVSCIPSEQINKTDYNIKYNNKNIIGYKNNFIGDNRFIRLTQTINDLDILNKKKNLSNFDIIVIGGSLINLGKNKSASDCHLLLNYVNNLLF